MRFGVDTGGTFTDIVRVNNNKISIHKIPSTPDNPAKAIIEGLKVFNITQQIIDMTHGSTVATNALLEKKGENIALLTTKGFKDIFFIARGNRKKLYDLKIKQTNYILKRENIFEIGERVDKNSNIKTAVNIEEVKNAAEIIRKKKINTIAVVFLFSFFNNSNEQRVKSILEEYKFNLHLSSEICREFREYERTSTTVLNAYLSPVMKNYLKDLSENIRGELSVISSAGGIISAEQASDFAINTLLSGPAAGVKGAFRIAKQSGVSNIITFDMGGTSTDVSLCQGKVSEKHHIEIDGLPVRTPAIDIHTIGAGGGSIAYFDEGNALCVGPESAGAYPGPVCYGRCEDAVNITVTDTNLFLNRLCEDYFLGGKMPLYKDRVIKYINVLAKSGGLTPEGLATGILRIAELKMESAIRVISVERGFNIEDFTLVTYGGAGALHACSIAKRTGIKEIIIPVNPGLLSALGMLLSDKEKQTAKTVLLKPGNEKDVSEIFCDMMKSLLQSERFHDYTIYYYADIRYKGQSFEITIPYDENNYIQEFHNAHEKLYSFKDENREIEIVTLRLKVIKPVNVFQQQKFGLTAKNINDAVLREQTFFVQDEIVTGKVYDRAKLRAGNVIEGPAIITEYSSTTLLNPGDILTVDEYLNFRIKIGA